MPLNSDNDFELMQFTPIPALASDKFVTVWQKQTQLIRMKNELFEIHHSCKLINEIYYYTYIEHKIVDNTFIFNLINNQSNKNCNLINTYSLTERVVEICNIII